MSEAPKAILEIGGEEYTLQFNREAVRRLEAAQQAPTREEMGDVPLSLVTAMFHAALHMHHRTPPNKAQGLLDTALDEGYDFAEISEVLVKLYNAVFTPPAPKGGEKPKLKVLGLDAIEGPTE